MQSWWVLSVLPPLHRPLTLLTTEHLIKNLTGKSLVRTTPLRPRHLPQPPGLRPSSRRFGARSTIVSSSSGIVDRRCMRYVFGIGLHPHQWVEADELFSLCIVPALHSKTSFAIIFRAQNTTVIREARQGLPFTLSPEYLAAQRAYMRYHNMNPIFGISSR